jgi:hypothetical protein
MSYITKVLGYSPIGYWPMNEAAGGTAFDYSGNGFDGSYTGVTLGQAGIGDGETCPYFDGANDYNNVYSAGFIASFDGTKGTFSIWVKVSDVSVWTDSTTDSAFDFDADGVDNIIRIDKSAVNNRLDYFYKAGGILKSVLKTSISDTGWMHLGLTWDKTADEMKAYYNGSQEGSTQSGLGTWAGNPLSTRCIIGAQSTTPALPWNGNLAHPAIWDSALTPAQIADLAVEPSEFAQIASGTLAPVGVLVRQLFEFPTPYDQTYAIALENRIYSVPG